MKPVALILLGVVGIVGFFLLTNKHDKVINKIGLENINLKFSGIVTEVEETNSYNGYGIIRMNIISSNIEAYDPRDSTEFYYCIIKNRIAEVYGHAFSRLIGDTLNIDTEKELMSLGGLGNEHDEGSIKINSNKDYYEYIKRKTKFK